MSLAEVDVGLEPNPALLKARMVGIEVYRDDETGAKLVRAIWVIPSVNGDARRIKKKVSKSVRDEWLARAGFAAFVTAVKDDTTP